MEHKMRLYGASFDRIKAGRKKIELRLFDEKRQILNLGDIITFSRLPDLDDSVSAQITGLLRYRTFRELVDDLPMSLFGYPVQDRQDLVGSVYQFYSAEDEKKYGVLGIRIRLV